MDAAPPSSAIQRPAWKFGPIPCKSSAPSPVSFRHQGETTWIDGQTILRRIIYSPEAVTRIYAGSDFIIRERLFVPLDEPGAIIAYETESTRPIDIEIRFIPVLDLMWPASMGGQEILWSSAASAYLLSEPTHRFAASIGSPDIVAHDETPNNTQHVGHAPGLAFTIRAGGGHERRRESLSPGADRGKMQVRLRRSSWNTSPLWRKLPSIITPIY